MNKKLVIFDCDGVLLDSEIIAHRVLAKELSAFGFSLTVERSIELFSGIAEEKMLEIFEREYGESLDEEKFHHIVSCIENCLSQKLKAISNINKFLDYLQDNNIDRCIASNSEYRYIINSLSLAKLSDYFDKERIFDVDMVMRGKLYPDLFLHAAKKLQVKPKDCVVIEDSIVGITAAKAANMSVIGFLGASHAKIPSYYQHIAEAKPDVIVSDAFELLECWGGI